MDTAAGLAVAVMVVAAMTLLWVMQKLGRGSASRLMGSRHKSRAQARSHFVAAAELLARARSAKTDSAGGKRAARDAARECDKAISIDPKDAAAHIIKALALEHLGHRAGALRCLSTALSPPLAKSLSPKERADALFRRALMTLAAASPGSRRASTSALEDLHGCLELNPELASRAYPIMATCYDTLRMDAEATSCRHRAAAASARAVL